MKMKFQHVSAFLVLLPLVFGCRMHTSSPRPTIPLVEQIINDTQGREYSFFRNYDPKDVHGDIVLLDLPERCFYLSERLVTCDDRDNFDGSLRPDQLPDFAGERITSLIDLVYPPYAGYIEADNTAALREVTVRAALCAVDTVCCLGPFDHECRSWKPSSKLLVVSSPYMAAYGAFDIDTLFRSVGTMIPVISAPEEMMARVMDRHVGSSVSIGILSDSLTAVSGVYETVFKDLARKRGDAYSKVSSFCPPSAGADSADVFKLILDQYYSEEKSRVLNALVVDDFAVSVDSLQASYRRILSRPSEENAFYRKMLAKDFEFIDGSSVITDACYRYLRENNLFTHNIAYPQAAAYITSPESREYTLMDFDENALPVTMAEELRSLSPRTFKMYVQDQYHARGN